MQGKLAVAAALYPQLVDDIQSRRAKHLILLVRKCHRGRDNYGVAGVYAHRVQVLHGADGDGVACAVPHDLELYLLPPGDALFNQHLSDRRERQTICGYLPKLPGIVHNTAACAPKGKGRPDYHRIAYLPGKGLRVLHGGHHLRGHTGLAYALHGVLK